MQNRVAIDMIVKHIQRTLAEKSKVHQAELQSLRQEVKDEPLSSDILLLKQTKQIVGMCTIIQNPMTDAVDFNFYFDRLSSLLVERLDWLLISFLIYYNVLPVARAVTQLTKHVEQWKPCPTPPSR